MNEQYFSNNPQSKHDEKQIETVVNGIELKLITDSGVFSRDRVDYGSQRLIETFSENVFRFRQPFSPEHAILI